MTRRGLSGLFAEPMTPLREILKATLKRFRREEVTAISQIEKGWPAIVGPVLAVNTSPLKIIKGTLQIRATTSAWTQELHFHKAGILERLARAYPDIKIRRISVTC